MSAENTNAGGGEAVEREALLLTSAEEAARWFTRRLSNSDWRPNRGNIEAARNTILDAAAAGRRLAALSAQSTGSGGVAADPVAWAWAWEGQSEGGQWHACFARRKPNERPWVRNIQPLFIHPLKQGEPAASDGKPYGYAFISLCSEKDAFSFTPPLMEAARNIRPLYEHPPVAAAPTPPAGGGETERSAIWGDPASPEAIAEIKRDLASLRNYPASPAGDLNSLSAGATQGEASFAVEAFRIPECDDADLPGILRIGNVEIAQVHEKYGPGVTPRYETDGAFIAALWNAFRSGRLVEAAPAAPRKGPSEEEIASKRESIARIFKPEHWADWDRHFNHAINSGNNIKEAKASANRHYGFMTKFSLTKADEIIALITPADRGETQAVGDGWQIVPVEPTEDMVQAGWIDKEDVDPDDIYRAMLAAAPSPDQNRGEPDQGGAITEAGR